MADFSKSRASPEGILIAVVYDESYTFSFFPRNEGIVTDTLRNGYRMGGEWLPNGYRMGGEWLPKTFCVVSGVILHNGRTASSGAIFQSCTPS